MNDYYDCESISRFIKPNGKTILLIHYNSEWDYHSDDVKKGNYGNHELYIVYEKYGILHNKNLLSYITLNHVTSYWLNVDGIKFTDFDKNTLYLIQEIILLFNAEPERSIEHRYKIIDYCSKTIDHCDKLDQAIVYTYSSMLDHKDFKIVNKKN